MMSGKFNRFCFFGSGSSLLDVFNPGLLLKIGGRTTVFEIHFSAKTPFVSHVSTNSCTNNLSSSSVFSSVSFQRRGVRPFQLQKDEGYNLFNYKTWFNYKTLPIYMAYPSPPQFYQPLPCSYPIPESHTHSHSWYCTSMEDSHGFILCRWDDLNYEWVNEEPSLHCPLGAV